MMKKIVLRELLCTCCAYLGCIVGVIIAAYCIFNLVQINSILSEISSAPNVSSYEEFMSLADQNKSCYGIFSVENKILPKVTYYIAEDSSVTPVTLSDEYMWIFVAEKDTYYLCKDTDRNLTGVMREVLKSRTVIVDMICSLLWAIFCAGFLYVHKRITPLY